MKARPYQESVTFLDVTNMTEETVVSRTDPTVSRHVVLRMTEHTTQSCCYFLMRGIGFKCYNVTAVVCEKYGSVNIYRYFQTSPNRSMKNVIWALVFSFPSEDEM